MSLYRNKPVAIEAITFDELVDCYAIPTANGAVWFYRDDMLCSQDVNGKTDLWPVAREIFEATYEPVDVRPASEAVADEGREVAWLIERSGKWWDGFLWTPVASDAIRFFGKADAERCMEAVNRSNYGFAQKPYMEGARATEHVFFGVRNDR